MTTLEVPNVTLDQLIARAERDSTKLDVFTTEHSDTRWIAYRRDGDTPRTTIVGSNNELFTCAGSTRDAPQKVFRQYEQLNIRREDCEMQYTLWWELPLAFGSGLLTFVAVYSMLPEITSIPDELNLFGCTVASMAASFGLVGGWIMGHTYARDRLEKMLPQKEEIEEYDAFVRKHDIRTGLDAYLHLV